MKLQDLNGVDTLQNFLTTTYLFTVNIGCEEVGEPDIDKDNVEGVYCPLDAARHYGEKKYEESLFSGNGLDQGDAEKYALKEILKGIRKLQDESDVKEAIKLGDTLFVCDDETPQYNTLFWVCVPLD